MPATLRINLALRYISEHAAPYVLVKSSHKLRIASIGAFDMLLYFPVRIITGRQWSRAGIPDQVATRFFELACARYVPADQPRLGVSSHERHDECVKHGHDKNACYHRCNAK